MAESPARHTGERAKRWSLGPTLSHCRRVAFAGPVQIEGYPDHREVADHLALGLLLDLVDEAVHRLRDVGKFGTKPFAVEPGRHRLVVLAADVDDDAHVAETAVVVCSADHRMNLYRAFSRFLSCLPCSMQSCG